MVPFILSTKLNDYSNLKTVMSAIATPKNGKIAIAYSIWLVFFGTMTIAMSFYLRNISSLGTYKAALIVLGMYGLGCVICGIFPVDETKVMLTISAKIHGYVAVITFFMLMFIPLLMKRTLKAGGYHSFAVISNLVFIVAFIFFVLQIASEREQFSEIFLGNTGLWQRLYLAVLYFYITIVFYFIGEF